jgi:hypothetical protein
MSFTSRHGAFSLQHRCGRALSQHSVLQIKPRKSAASSFSAKSSRFPITLRFALLDVAQIKPNFLTLVQPGASCDKAIDRTGGACFHYHHVVEGIEALLPR